MARFFLVLVFCSGPLLAQNGCMFTRGSALPGERRVQEPLLKGGAHSTSYGRQPQAERLVTSAPREDATPVNMRPNGVVTPAKEEYTANDYSYLLGIKGFSDKALTDHFTLYQGYVKNTNLLVSILQKLARDGKLRTPEFMALKRRLGWEFDGMRLHEYYFDNMGGSGKPDTSSELYKALMRDFGSYEAWKQDFVATGMIRGIGWSVLYQDPQTGRLFNTWINEHDTGHLAGGTPLLVMDVWEHAVMPDYGLDRQAYINAFFDILNWDIVEKRYAGANDPAGMQVPVLVPTPAPNKTRFVK